MPKRGESGNKRFKLIRTTQKEPSKNPKVAAIHYPDPRTIRFWRETMTPREFVQAIAKYSRLVDE